MVGPSGMTSFAHPCFDHATLTDLLDNPPSGARKGLNWRYYTPSEGTIWNAPSSVRHMCMPKGYPQVCTGADWSDGKIAINPAQVLTDIQQRHLASVSWVIPKGQESDHPISNNGSGPSWVASVVNAVGNSPYWNNTVILIAWDDWGGFYDHVAPPIDSQYGYYEYGFRVPLLVVSAYTPAGYVSQSTHNFGSILRFIETAFGLPFIPPSTFADSRSDDLGDFFDFTKPPRPFVPVPAPIKASFFLHDLTPATDPDDD
jgi:phospholipase C